MSSILVIEDQEVLCRLYEAVLGELRHEVVIAYTGEEGLNAARESRPDLIILDLELPGISGITVAQALQYEGILPGIPVIITTATPREEVLQMTRSFEVLEILIKPFDILVLLDAIGNALANPK
ncbi:MAG: response regulator [Chloroflexi bacterium]|nr:response regulator [Chloroflexota bacterium]